MGIVALLCAVILLLIIPNEVWAALFYLGLIALVAFIGWTAFIFWVIG